MDAIGSTVDLAFVFVIVMLGLAWLVEKAGV
jgi:hypothetical protein